MLSCCLYDPFEVKVLDEFGLLLFTVNWLKEFDVKADLHVTWQASENLPKPFSDYCCT